MGSSRKKRREAERAASKSGAGAGKPGSSATAGGTAAGWYGAKRPALRFLLVAGGFMLLFYGVFYTSPEDSPGINAAIESYLSIYSAVTGFLFELFGFHVQILDTLIILDGKPVRVVRGCDAMEPIALYVAAVLAVQVGDWRSKLIGVGGGVALLVLVNLLRIIALTFISARFPSFFDTAHLTVGQTLFIVCTLSLWFAWVVWASKKDEEASGAAPSD